MRLNKIPFDLINVGDQVIETRLNDEKRQLLSVGDKIEFSLRGSSEKKIVKTVEGLLVHKNFKDLYISREPQNFGGKSVEELLESILKYYTKEDELKFGVVGIQLK